MEMEKSDMQLKKQIEKRIDEYGYNLYHYTSMSTFISMLNSRELWLSNTGTMNDRKETIYFIEMIQKELKEYQRNDFSIKYMSRYQDIINMHFVCRQKKMMLHNGNDMQILQRVFV